MIISIDIEKCILQNPTHTHTHNTQETRNRDQDLNIKTVHVHELEDLTVFCHL